MSLGRRLSTGVAWMFAGISVEQVCGFVIIIILARLLKAEGIGLFMMAMLFVIFAEFLVRDTIGDALISLDEVEPGHLDAAFWSLIGCSTLVAIFIVLLAQPIALAYSEPIVARFLYWMWPTVTMIALGGVPTGVLRRKLEFRALALSATLGVVLGGVVGISMALLGYGPWSLVGQRLVQILFNNIVVWVAVDWRPGFRATRRHFQDIRAFSVNILGLRAMEVISLQTPTFVIGYALGPAALGYFTIAWRIVEATAFVLITPVRFVAQPAFAELERAAGWARELLRDMSEASAMITFATFLGLAAVAGPAIYVLFGPGWEPAVPVLRVLCLVGIFLAIEKLQQAFCLATGHVGKLFALSASEAVLGAALMLAWAQYGLVAVAAAFVARYYLLWPIRFHIVKKIADVAIWQYFKVFISPFAAAATMAGAVLGWQHFMAGRLSELVMLVSAVIIGIAVYGTILLATMQRRVRRILLFARSGGMPPGYGDGAGGWAQ